MIFFKSEIRERLDLFSTLMALKTCSGLMCNDIVQFQIEMRRISRRRPRSVEGTELGYYLVVVLQRTAKKCTESYNARAQLLFCLSYNTEGPLFGDLQNVLHNENHEKFQP